VTPTSLVNNWVKETKKWLGPERLQPVWIGDGATKENKKKLEDFVSAPVQQMLVLSYENVRQNVQILKKCRFRLMICDEGHRLKNNDAKISISLMELDCPRRILMTGTPFQNNLGEFFSLANFVNPGILGTQSQFKQIYDSPISKLHDPRCNPAQRALGAERAAELARLTKAFILRRTSDVLENFLPPKVEHVIFCRPTETQIKLANHFLESEFAHRALTGQASSLACIQHLSKIFNHPELLLGPSSNAPDAASKTLQAGEYDDFEGGSDDDEYVVDDDIEEIRRLFPTKYKFGSFEPLVASKLDVLSSILDRLGPKDKIVVVSNFTKTLDVIEKLCSITKKLPTLRLDGRTENTARQQRVDSFQSDSKQRVFLLSTKAGGVGLNLFAANRLVLFDSGWNPAHDAQAQARVWRDGQMQKTFIYRLLNTGTMEEKIFQRQISKLGMSKTVVDTDARAFFGRMKSTHFSPEELKDIFSINEETVCDTHDLSGCSCAFSVRQTAPHIVRETYPLYNCLLYFFRTRTKNSQRRES
jgi:DNA repair and recombination protein RAD54B